MITNLYDPEKTPQTPALGPLSAVFDWNKEEEKIQAEREKSKEANQKIIKTNAIGEVFRALADTAGVAMGGTAKAAPMNPLALQAFNDIKQQDVTYREQLERLNTRKLSAAQQQLQADLGREELARRESEAGKQREFEAGQNALNRENQLKVIEANKIAELENILARNKQDEANLRTQAALTKDLTILKAAEDMALENKKHENTIAEYKAKSMFDRGMFSEADLQEGGMWNLSKPKTGESGRVSFIVPDIKREIGLSTGAVTELSRQLANKLMGPEGNMWATEMPTALREIAMAKNPPMTSILTALANNWDWIKDPKNGILPAPVYKAIYGSEPTTATEQSATVQKEEGSGLNDKIDLILNGKPYHRSNRPAIEKAVAQEYPSATPEQQKQIAEGIIKQLIGK